MRVWTKRHPKPFMGQLPAWTLTLSWPVWHGAFFYLRMSATELRRLTLIFPSRVCLHSNGWQLNILHKNLLIYLFILAWLLMKCLVSVFVFILLGNLFVLSDSRFLFIFNIPYFHHNVSGCDCVYSVCALSICGFKYLLCSEKFSTIIYSLLPLYYFLSNI